MVMKYLLFFPGIFGFPAGNVLLLRNEFDLNLDLSISKVSLSELVDLVAGKLIDSVSSLIQNRKERVTFS